MIRYEFDPLPPTPNQMLRMHWGKRGKAKSDLMWQIRAQEIKEAPEPCEIHALWTVYRKMDADNAIGRLKLVIDALKEMGVLKDDSLRYVKLVDAEQERTNDPRKQKLIIEIREQGESWTRN